MTRRAVGIVADDLTGANDAGCMLAKRGFLTKVFLGWEGIDAHAADADVVVVDTDSRAERSAAARERAGDATRKLLSLGFSRIYKKTCSAFRGNVGAEIDGCMDAMGRDFCVVVPAFPNNGRQTRHGLHYVHGQLLEQSALARDPVNPMRESHLPTILAAQTARAVAHVDLTVVRAGEQRLRQELNRLRASANLVIIDAEAQRDLAAIAAAVRDEPLISGSAGLAEELAALWGGAEIRYAPVALPGAGARSMLIAAGSVTPETRAQNAHALAHGVAGCRLDPAALLDDDATRSQIALAARCAAGAIEAGRRALLYTAAEVEATLAAGRARGLSDIETSQRVACGIAEAVAGVMESIEVGRLLVAGGHTAVRVCERLGVVGNVVLREIQSGVPSGLAIGRDSLLVVLKSGSFGSESFYLDAAEHLEEGFRS